MRAVFSGIRESFLAASLECGSRAGIVSFNEKAIQYTPSSFFVVYKYGARDCAIGGVLYL
jgi:hypothetical protein